MLLYYITDRRQFSGTETEKRERLLAKIAEAARVGVDYIQLREKDLCPRDLTELAQEAVRRIRAAIKPLDGSTSPQLSRSKLEIRNPKLLINSRLDVALASGADGVHLTSTDIPASDARAAWAKATSQTAPPPIIAVSCHTPEDVRLAEAHGADFVVFAPVFEKVATGQSGVGLTALQRACARRPASAGPEASIPVKMPVLALGGVTVENAADCVEAGAAGIAGIRLFQNNDIGVIVAALRKLHNAGARS